MYDCLCDLSKLTMNIMHKKEKISALNMLFLLLSKYQKFESVLDIHPVSLIRVFTMCSVRSYKDLNFLHDMSLR